MNARFFYAEACFKTWPKLFVLTEDSRFYCEYLDFMKPATVDLRFDFDNFKASDYKWGDYQSMVEVDENQAKSMDLIQQVNWISEYLESL